MSDNGSWMETKLVAELSTALDEMNEKFQLAGMSSMSSSGWLGAMEEAHDGGDGHGDGGISGSVGSGSTGDKDLVSAQVAHFFTVFITLGVCAALSFLGVIANVINILVFVRQGFQDSINVSLCAISASDLVSAVTLLWYTVCKNPLFLEADLPFLPGEIEPLTSGIPHAIAMNATGWLTAYVTLERCLCVVFPLKVKDIISGRRTKVVVVAIFTLVIGAQMPSYYTLRLGWRFEPERNKTVLGLYAIEGSELIDKVTFYIINVTAPIMSFLVVWTCSIILIFHLHQKSKWRQTATATATATPATTTTTSIGRKSSDGELLGKEGTLTSRDWKVVRMVTIVAVIFVTSFTPYVLISTVMAIEPGFRFYGAYRYTFTVCVSVGSLLESLNALSTTFVYYVMSLKYKATFRNMFCR